MATALSILLAANGFQLVVNQVRDTFVRVQMNAAVTAATVLCCICCILYLAELARKLLAGTEVTVWDALRPVVVLMCTASFNTIVLAPVDYVFNKAIVDPVEKVSVGLSSTVKSVRNQRAAMSATSADDLFGDSESASEQQIQMTYLELRKAASAAKRNTFMRFLLGQSGVEVTEWLQLHVLAILEAVAYAIFGLIKEIVYVLSEVQLAILAVFGPFVFAIDILPGLSGIGTWIARYIQISFWKVTVVILGLFINSATEFVYVSGVSKIGGSGLADYSNAWMASLAIICAGIACLFKVETISRYIVHGDGDGGAAGAAYRGIMIVGGSARRAIGSVMGKI